MRIDDVRHLALVTLLCVCAAGSAQELLRVADLSPRGEELERILHALLHGRPLALATTSAAVFTSPLTTGRADQHGVVRHWRWDFLARLADDDLEARSRATIIAGLDRLARRPETTAAQALRLTPAPAAVERVADAAARAFDRGRLRDYLGLASELDRLAPGWESAPGRRAAAERLLGLKPPAHDPLHLGQPGPLVPTSALPPLLELDAGHAVHWRVAHGHLLACDPWLQVRWQRALEPRAQVRHGGGAAAVRTERSLVVLDEEGHGSERPIAPAVRLLGVRGGAAWLAVAHRVHALAPDGATRGPITLAGEPIAAPLVQGERSLWLTATTLEYAEGDEVVLRSHHGLGPGPWRLLLSRSGPAISDGERHLLLGPPRAEAHPAERWHQHLVRAGRGDVALAQDDLAPELRALAWLTTTGAAIPRAAIEDLALEPELRLHLAITAAGGLPLAANDDAARTLAAAHPTLLVPGPDDDPRDHPAHWRHVVAGAALADDRPVLGRDPDDAVPVEPAPAVQPLRHAELGAVQREDDLLLRVRRDGRWIEVAVHDQAGTLRWRQRFAAAGFFLPSVAVALVGEAVLVAEGQSRVSVFDRRTGLLWGRLRKPVDLPLRALVPLGGDRAGHLASDGTGVVLVEGERSRPLPLPAARWVVPVAGGAVVATADGARRLPGLEPVDWPPGLLAGDVPQAERSGLRRDGLLWPWRR